MNEQEESGEAILLYSSDKGTQYLDYIEFNKNKMITDRKTLELHQGITVDRCSLNSKKQVRAWSTKQLLSIDIKKDNLETFQVAFRPANASNIDDMEIAGNSNFISWTRSGDNASMATKISPGADHREFDSQGRLFSLGSSRFLHANVSSGIVKEYDYNYEWVKAPLMEHDFNPSKTVQLERVFALANDTSSYILTSSTSEAANLTINVCSEDYIWDLINGHLSEGCRYDVFTPFNKETANLATFSHKTKNFVVYDDAGVSLIVTTAKNGVVKLKPLIGESKVRYASKIHSDGIFLSTDRNRGFFITL
jgi:hypothetical protein